MPELPLHIKYAKLFRLIPIPDGVSYIEAKNMFWRAINGRVYRIIDWVVPKNIGMWKPHDAIITLFYGIYPHYGRKGIECAIFHFFLDMTCFYARTSGERIDTEEIFGTVVGRLEKILFVAEKMMEKRGIVFGTAYLQKPTETFVKIAFMMKAKEKKGEKFALETKTFIRYLRGAISRVKRYGRKYILQIVMDCLVARQALSEKEIAKEIWL